MNNSEFQLSLSGLIGCVIVVSAVSALTVIMSPPIALAVDGAIVVAAFLSFMASLGGGKVPKPITHIVFISLLLMNLIAVVAMKHSSH